MLRTETHNPWTRLLLVLFLGLALCAAPAAADEKMAEGEPTDPEGVLYILGGIGMDLGGETAAQPATGTEGYDSWYEKVVELLRSLGLLPAEGRSK